ncbi:MAG: nucleoside recognition domain-containing protein [Thermodesulfobacteriota bacterium]|nr:nucleoside recognition domain-containing protein [Thermodesulfobacteriota bacterium]
MIVNIVDASNIERNLYLTVQLLEMKIPVVVALNMMDIVKQHSIEIHVKQLENFLGCPVVPTVANKNKGIDRLKDTINTVAVDKKISPVAVEYPAEIEKAIANLIPLVEKDASRKNIDTRWLAVKILEGDEMAIDIAGDIAKPLLLEASKEIKANLGDDSDIMVADSRYGFINGIYRDAVQKKLEVRRTVSDAIDTVLLNPFMSCGARLPVYALFAAAFFPHSGSTLVFALYLTGIALAIMTDFILKSTVLRGETSHFIMELPPYHRPTFRGIIIHTYDRLKQFMFRAGKILMPIFVILAFLNSMGTDGSFGHEDSKTSVLSAAGQSITPIFRPMGLTDENWPATVGIFTGIFAKEAVVGTLDALYSAMGESEEGEREEENFSFWGGIGEAFASIPAAFSELGGTVTDPLGVGIDDDLTDLDAVAEDQEVTKSTFGAMIKRFDGRIGAIAYLLFVLIYYPCLAAIAAIYRETNLKWTIFIGTYLTLLAWAAATLFYQLATFGRHPGESLTWVTVIGLAFIAFLYGMRRAGRRSPSRSTVKEVAQPI